jgi:hypothetical protein
MRILGTFFHKRASANSALNDSLGLQITEGSGCGGP